MRSATAPAVTDKHPSAPPCYAPPEHTALGSARASKDASEANASESAQSSGRAPLQTLGSGRESAGDTQYLARPQEWAQQHGEGKMAGDADKSRASEEEREGGKATTTRPSKCRTGPCVRKQWVRSCRCVAVVVAVAV